MKLSPEWSFLLPCSKSNLTVEECRLIQRDAARVDLDWDYIKTASHAHGIAPLIYHSLVKSDVTGLVPPPTAQALQTAYYGNGARNALLYNDLHSALLALREEKIEVIALKGAALAETVYPHRALRPMSDIDLLVRKEQLDKVETKLLDMGYLFDGHGKTKEFYLERRYHWVFARRSGITIEIHWHIKRPTSPFRIDIDGMWERAQPTQIAGVEALVFSPEDLLLHLCQHMHKHNLIGGIRPLCDIAHVVEYFNNAIDWTEFRTRASQWGISPYVYLMLYLAKELLHARIPSSFLDGFEPPGFDRGVIPWAKERFFENGESSPISQNLAQLCWNGHGFRDRLAALGSALSPQVVAQAYGVPQDSNRIPFHYYPQRIKYLLNRYGPLLWHLAAGDQKTRFALKREDNQLRLNRWLSSGYQSGS